MIWTGLLVFAFVVYHLLHFTIGTTNPDHHGLLDAQGRKDVYRMVVLGFQQAPIAIGYLVAMLLLWSHLQHGITSIFQSMGWNAPQYERLTTNLGRVLSTLIVLGNSSMPLLVLAGVVGRS
jgi:succinate dehydrogenase / fumarate reductase cytochrome b subunit